MALIMMFLVLDKLSVLQFEIKHQGKLVIDEISSSLYSPTIICPICPTYTQPLVEIQTASPKISSNFPDDYCKRRNLLFQKEKDPETCGYCETFGKFGIRGDIESKLKEMGMTLVSDPRKKCSQELAICSLIEAEGDFIETGVFTGSTAALLKNILEACEMGQPPTHKRKLYLADSWEGLPKLETQADINDPLAGEGFFKSSYHGFLEFFYNIGFLDQSVIILRGWFSATLPALKQKKFSFLRLDGDLYISTMDALNNLYPSLSPGGYVYVDDYGSFTSCKAAVDEYRTTHNITEPLHVYKKDPEAAWWQKKVSN